MVAELKKIGIVKKKLCHHKIRPAINLVFQPPLTPMYLLFLAGDVPFRKTSGADGEPAQFLDVGDKLIRELKAALGFFEFAVAARRVAP